MLAKQPAGSCTSGANPIVKVWTAGGAGLSPASAGPHNSPPGAHETRRLGSPLGLPLLDRPVRRIAVEVIPLGFEFFRTLVQICSDRFMSPSDAYKLYLLFEFGSFSKSLNVRLSLCAMREEAISRNRKDSRNHYDHGNLCPRIIGCRATVGG